MKCPACHGREVGRIGSDQYFCWTCQVEFNKAAEVYIITEDGNLLKVAVS